jgi:UDP-N-acetylglucosamine 4,6-dehydratase
VKNAMVLGGTGTIGSAVCAELVTRGLDVVAVSRDDTKLAVLHERHPDVAMLLADVTNETDIRRIETVFNINDIDCMVNAAAIKHVGACEEAILPALRVNTMAAERMAAICSVQNKRHVYISTDKAVEPLGVLGMTKALGERVVRQYGGLVIRFGNIIGSRGSVLPIWQEQMAKSGRLKITGVDMMRWWIGLDEAARFIADVAMGLRTNDTGLFVPDNMMHLRVVDVMRAAFGDKVEFDIVEPKFGEKQDEQLYWPGEAPAGKPVGAQGA